MREIANGVWQLQGRLPNLINTYLVADVLIDAGVRSDAGRILSELRGRTVTAHALTHAHPDHLGSSHRVCEELEIPFWVSEGDADAAQDPDVLRAVLRGRRSMLADPALRLFVAAQVAGGHPVARRLREGDEVGGFEVLETPGHSPGHIAFWRASDRVLILGDVVWNFRFVGGRPGMTLPPNVANSDSARNRESARRLAALEPAIVCFGHGPVLGDGAAFVRFVGSLTA